MTNPFSYSSKHAVVTGGATGVGAALLDAVAEHTRDWGDVDRALAAAMFDVLWSPVSYERIVIDWDVDPKEAIRGITWVVGLIRDAIAQGDGPGA